MLKHEQEPEFYIAFEDEIAAQGLQCLRIFFL